VAMELKLTAKKPNPYQKWLDDYSSKHYSEAVEQMISLSDRYAMKADEKMRMQMETAFVTASWLEWYFWENAYQE
jgi:thiaminase/transcriptional activator TenA